MKISRSTGYALLAVGYIAQHKELDIVLSQAISKALPGRLWRIYGPEYASPPYQSPAAFHDYVVRYDQPMVDAIQKHGGFVRMHSHGNR